MGLTMKEKHAVTKQPALTYKRAGKKDKGKILDTVIELECKGYDPISGCSLRNQFRSRYQVPGIRKRSFQTSAISFQERAISIQSWVLHFRLPAPDL